MRIFRLATASLNQTPLDWSGNRKRIIKALRILSTPDEKFSGSPDAILFPELSISGYGCEDAFHSLDVTERAFQSLELIASESKNILPDTLIFVGLPVRKNDFIYNAIAAVHGGRIQGIVPKQNLAGDGVHYEPRWFAPFREPGNSTLIRNDAEIPFGRLLYEFHGVKLGIEICEDAWVAARPSLDFLSAGTDIVLNPAASHFAMGKQEIRRNIVMESSRSLCTVFATVNLLGNEAGRLLYDGGSIIASNGFLLSEGERFSFQDVVVNEVRIDIHVNRVQRARIYSYHDQDLRCPSPTQRESIIRIAGSVPASGAGFQIPSNDKGSSRQKNDAGSKPPNRPIPRPPQADRNREFLRAVTLALFDYMRKSHSRGFVLSLSGGADSATVAILIHRMIAYSIAELGCEFALKKGGISPLFENELKTEDFKSVHENFNASSRENRELLLRVTKQIASKILHTIYQKSENSSDVTRDAARDIAEITGSDHHEADISDAVKFYTSSIEQILRRQLSWETDDLSLQNIQARVRSPMAWFFANTTGSLLLTTSNRSESAVGYCTMDGDTSGGLAPITGASKDFIRNWLIFMEENGDELCGAVPELRSVNRQQPTAELRPRSSTQRDEDDLMPYAMLDRIEILAVRDRKSPGEIFEILSNSTDIGYTSDQLRAYIRRFFRLWSANQWKRERYAPSFHLDDENLDPRSWYRFPILNGGYQEELSELDD